MNFFVGYWQDVNLILNNKDFLYSSLSHNKLIKEGLDYKSKPGKTLLHIRRGDFLINSANHHNLDLVYYDKALAEFPTNVPVIIFSDDPEWCNGQEIFADDRFLVSEGNSAYIDMCLMSLCEGHIIANSSFSCLLYTSPSPRD